MRLHRQSNYYYRRRPNRSRLWLVVVLVIAGYWMIGHSEAAKTVKADTKTSVASVASKPKIQRVGLQAGHWKNDELPSEFPPGITYSSGGSVNDVNEWEVVLDVAQRAAKLLQAKNIAVDVLPATVPVGYQADAFVALHTDGNDDTSVTGYKLAATVWDTGVRSGQLASAIDLAYSQATGLPKADYISPEMEQYYVFNYNHYQHTISPQTPAVIVELGFLTNDGDRYFFLHHSDKMAQGIANGVLNYLTSIKPAS